MLTDTFIATLADMAGDDFTYPGVTGDSRLPTRYGKAGNPRIGLRLWLAVEQGGICPACGDALDESAEYFHIVSRGPQVRGFIPGNVIVAHSVCNTRAKDRGPIVWTADLARPDLVPLTWPARADLARLSPTH